MSKFCQSCGMPLREKQDYGTEKDGSQAEKFCSYCYQHGNYINPELTFEEMKEIGLKGIDDGGGNAFARWILKRIYPTQLKNLERWNKKSNE